MQLSYWEKNSFFNHPDVVIIGSGIVGLHAAIFIKEKKPSWDVLVLERGFLPYGASTRNAGFACFGSAGELLDDMNVMSESEVFQIVEKRYRGLSKLRKVLGDEAMCYEPLGGYEVFAEEDQSTYERCMDQLEYLNRMLHAITGNSLTYTKDDAVIEQCGMKGFQHVIRNACEGQLDTGKMMTALLNKACHTGVRIMNGIEIRGLSESGNGAELETGQGFAFKAGQVLVTTNGFAQQLLPGIDLVPARAQVIVSSPVPGLKLKGAFHYDKGFYYFRNVGDRILFGGGRNLDFTSEGTTAFGITTLIQEKLESMLTGMIVPYSSCSVDFRWSGIMGLGSSKTSIVTKISDHIACAVRMGGMGVAIGSLVGEEGATLVLES